jgi:hypothetical protein
VSSRREKKALIIRSTQLRFEMSDWRELGQEEQLDLVGDTQDLG